MLYFTLDEKRNSWPCEDFGDYQKWHDAMPPSSDWYTMKTGLGFVVGLDEVGDDRVSTVFLGINHNYFGGCPLLWETMVFPDGEVCQRYSTYEEAMIGHREMVESLQAAVR